MTDDRWERLSREVSGAWLMALSDHMNHKDNAYARGQYKAFEYVLRLMDIIGGDDED